MPLPKEQQRDLLEGHVGKIDRAMQNVVRDGKKLSEVLDAEALTKLAAYLHTRVNDMITDLGKAKRSVFSLDAPAVQTIQYLDGVSPQTAVVREVVIPGDMIVHGSLTAKPSVPQPVADNDDEELAAVVGLMDDDSRPPPPRTAEAMFEVAPAAPDPTKPPRKWRKPTGRLVGTKEPVWVETDPPKKENEDPTEKPDDTGYIKEAGFLDGE